MCPANGRELKISGHFCPVFVLGYGGRLARSSGARYELAALWGWPTSGDRLDSSAHLRNHRAQITVGCIMRVLVVGAAMLAATGANASDLGAALSKSPAAMWNGFYAGVNVGAAFAGSSGLDTPADQWGSITPFSEASGTTSNAGAVGGFQAGVSKSVGSFVFGIEADISLASAGATNTDEALFSSQYSGPTYSTSSWQATNTTYQTSLDWYATIRARLGYAVMPNLVIFGTGGLAFGGVSLDMTRDYAMGFTSSSCEMGICSTNSQSDAYTYKARGTGYAVGWAAGAGVDYALGNGITVRAEYLYISLGTVSFDDVATLPTNTSVSQTISVARVAANYAF